MIPNRCQSALVLGGARSGKSRYAQAVAEGSDLAPVLIATARAGDAEMTERITRHKAERGPKWYTVEEPLLIEAAIAQWSSPARILVIDCVSFWIANLLFEGADVARAVNALADAIGHAAGPILFVSNEVGGGIVPGNALSRRFRDEQGRVNQILAGACSHVVLVAAGLPVLLKPGPRPELHF
jgi:adenosylcobinamide kinase/adenosylcobinamide-phosphate guanylyltransferase